VIEIYSSLDCPYGYLAAYRLQQLWPEYDGRLQLVWRALPLEYINERGAPRPLYEAERELFALIEPALPFQPWARPEWDWPATMWPAYEALACAQAQNNEAARLMSWRLRHGFFAESRNLALRHELMAVARQVAAEAPLELDRFVDDWDHGRYKQSVIDDARQGWHALKVNGSATLVLPDGRQVTNPAIGQVDFDEESYAVRGYTAYEGDPLATYRDLMQVALTG
jgi:predicted DsbA family dithiol-disulfide isomerase